eukprot:scaffold18391_cov70-Phaeocystis_antarctica.AAC.1
MVVRGLGRAFLFLSVCLSTTGYGRPRLRPCPSAAPRLPVYKNNQRVYPVTNLRCRPVRAERRGLVPRGCLLTDSGLQHGRCPDAVPGAAACGSHAVVRVRARLRQGGGHASRSGRTGARQPAGLPHDRRDTRPAQRPCRCRRGLCTGERPLPSSIGRVGRDRRRGLRAADPQGERRCAQATLVDGREPARSEPASGGGGTGVWRRVADASHRARLHGGVSRSEAF